MDQNQVDVRTEAGIPEKKLHWFDITIIGAFTLIIIGLIGWVFALSVKNEVSLVGIFALIVALALGGLGYWLVRTGESRKGQFSGAEFGGVVLIALFVLLLSVTLQTSNVYQTTAPFRLEQMEEPPPPLLRIVESNLENTITVNRISKAEKIYILQEYDPPASGDFSANVPSSTHGKVWYINENGVTSRAAEF